MSIKNKESDAIWTISTHGNERYRYDRKQKIHKSVNVTEELKKLFDGYGIDYNPGNDLKGRLLNKHQKNSLKI